MSKYTVDKFIEGETDGELILFNGEVLRETEKAILMKIGPENFEEEIWIPKSLLEEYRQ